MKRLSSGRSTLLTLCSVEAWERFSFYGMQGILLLYLYRSTSQGGLGFSQGTAVGLVGAYGSLVYLSTIAGAWVADRIAGREPTLFASACLVMLGHGLLATLPGSAGLTAGLLAVASGSGGLKANTTAVLGGVYADDAPARESGFALFYLGVNVGSLAGPLLTGVVQKTWGFHAGFAIAAIGMGCGLVRYAWGRNAFAAEFRDASRPLPANRRLMAGVSATLAAVTCGGLAVGGVMTVENLNDLVLWVIVIATVVLFAAVLRSGDVTSHERERVVAFVPMFLASTAFWALSQQQFTVLTVYADRQLDRFVLGWEIPVAWVQSINPFFIIALSGVSAAVWSRLGTRQPSSARKFALSNLVMGAAFLLFVPLAGTAANSVPLLPVVGILFLFSVAELLLAPVGLSFATAIAPQAFRSGFVALFYLSIALGTSLSGVLAGWYSVRHQTTYFRWLGIASLAIGLVLSAASRQISARTREAEGGGRADAAAPTLTPG